MKNQFEDHGSTAGLKMKKIGISSLAVATTGLVGAIIAVGISSQSIANNNCEANATSKLTVEKPTGDYLKEQLPFFSFQIEQSETTKGSASIKNIGSNDSLPTSYDSRTFGYVSRQENQAGEGLCWAYSLTTAAETYLKKSGLAQSTTELSPKHLDYALAQASEAFSDSTANQYEDYIYNLTGSHRSIADGGNYFSTLIVASGKYALVGDDAFFSKMKQNDQTTLSSYNTYSDYIVNLYNLAYEDYLENGSTSLPIEYKTKQKYADVFDPNTERYAITGAEFTELEYSQSGADSKQLAAVAEIKNDIKTYGAVAIASHYNEDKCMYKNGSNYTIIDRTTSSLTSPCDDSIFEPSDHGMTLVGWDDNWSYKDNDIDRTGAFILQNSYGDDGINYYFSYNSYALAFTITSMKESGEANNIIDNIDFEKNIDADQYEVIFRAHINDRKKPSQVSIFTTSITGAPILGWDVYIKNKDSQYVKVKRINDEARIGLYEIDDIDVDAGDMLDIKVKYDNGGYNIIGLNSNVFSEQIAPYIMATAYLDGNTAPADPEDPEDPGEPENPDNPEDHEEPAGTGKVEWEDDNDIYLIGYDTKLVVKIDYPLATFQSLFVDDKELAEENYDLKSGSTIITLHGDYLDTLESGIHNLKVVFSDNRIVKTEFEVTDDDIEIPNTSADETDKPSAPETGFNTKSNENNYPVAIMALPVISLIAAITGVIIYKTKRQKVTFDKK